MNRMKLLAVLLALTSALPAAEPSPAGGPSGQSPASQARPNFVFILADDLGWSDVGYHDSAIPTPNLDRLANEGVRLERHYVSPVCSPTRAGLMTGRYWSRFGITTPTSYECLPDGTATIASVLKGAGYRTAITGKWHLGGASLPDKRPARFGFEHSYGCLDGAAHPFTHVYTGGGEGGDDGEGIQTWHRNGEFIKEEGHVTDLITREAVGWIEKNKENPFFLYVPYTAPHKKCLDTPEWVAKCSHIPAAERKYAAMVAHMDDGVGKIVATLDRLGLRQNTLLVFSSDNGGVLAKPPLRGTKGSVWEGGVRGVAWANWPGRLAKGVLTQPVCIVDWMPTFCTLARATAPAALDGRDILPLLQQPGAAAEARPLYLLGPNSKSAALIDGDWKLLRTHNGDELCDLAGDVGEKNNLAAAQQPRLKQMQELVRELSAGDGPPAKAKRGARK